MMRMTFEKWDDGRWFVVLPEYEGDHDDLEMVGGANTLLDFLTTDNHLVTIDVADEKFPDANTLRIVEHDDFGGTYEVSGIKGFNQTVWLCNVMHYVFKEHPETIYFKVIDS